MEQQELHRNATVSLQTHNAQPLQSQQGLTLQTQNLAIIQSEPFERSELTPAIPSVFGNLPVAKDEDIAQAMMTLAICFPQMPELFWGLATKQARKLCLSKERLDYIVEYLTMTHKYPTLTMADIFGVDKSIHIITYEEYNALKVPHKPLAQIKFDNKYYTVYLEDAERCGYEYKAIESMVEREEREQKEREKRWQREYEELVAKGEIDPNNPRRNLERLVGEVSERMDYRKSEQKKQAKEKAAQKVRLKIIEQTIGLYKTDPEHASERIEKMINEELKKQNLL